MENPLLSARPVVLVVAPGDESYRGYCLEQVADAYDVVLLTGAEPSWEKPHITDHASWTSAILPRCWRGAGPWPDATTLPVS